MKTKFEVGDIVQNLKQDFSQKKGGFETKPIFPMTVGRVRIVHEGNSRFPEVAWVKFPGHPLTTFTATDLVKVKIPK